MKRVKRIVTALCILFPVFLLLVCSVILVGVTDDNDDGNPKHASGLGLSDKVGNMQPLSGIRQRNTTYMSMKSICLPS